MSGTFVKQYKSVYLLLATWCALLATPAQSAEPPLVVGVLPNVSARVIFANYLPVRSYLERELKRSVEITTAPDFRLFSEATLRGDYHLIVTAANLGRVAQLDGKWEPITIYEPSIPALLVTASDNANGSAEQLRGKTLAVANPQSLVVLRGLQWLREKGLQEGRDFKISFARNDDSPGTLIRFGEAPMAMMSTGDTRRAVPIIALTANALLGDREACIAAGMNDYLTKPQTHENLVKVLQQYQATASSGASLA
ncbi:MAG: PhnD/SsuA/transferrin family substrate-binding protein [Usitatibacteraceae bacterium]